MFINTKTWKLSSQHTEQEAGKILASVHHITCQVGSTRETNVHDECFIGNHRTDGQLKQSGYENPFDVWMCVEKNALALDTSYVAFRIYIFRDISYFEGLNSEKYGSCRRHSGLGLQPFAIPQIYFFYHSFHVILVE